MPAAPRPLLSTNSLQPLTTSTQSLIAQAKPIFFGTFTRDGVLAGSGVVSTRFRVSEQEAALLRRLWVKSLGGPKSRGVLAGKASAARRLIRPTAFHYRLRRTALATVPGLSGGHVVSPSHPNANLWTSTYTPRLASFRLLGNRRYSFFTPSLSGDVARLKFFKRWRRRFRRPARNYLTHFRGSLLARITRHLKKSRFFSTLVPTGGLRSSRTWASARRRRYKTRGLRRPTRSERMWRNPYLFLLVSKPTPRRRRRTRSTIRVFFKHLRPRSPHRDILDQHVGVDFKQHFATLNLGQGQSVEYPRWVPSTRLLFQPVRSSARPTRAVFGLPSPVRPLAVPRTRALSPLGHLRPSYSPVPGHPSRPLRTRISRRSRHALLRSLLLSATTARFGIYARLIRLVARRKLTRWSSRLLKRFRLRFPGQPRVSFRLSRRLGYRGRRRRLVGSPKGRKKLSRRSARRLRARILRRRRRLPVSRQVSRDLRALTYGAGSYLAVSPTDSFTGSVRPVLAPELRVLGLRRHKYRFRRRSFWRKPRYFTSRSRVVGVGKLFRRVRRLRRLPSRYRRLRRSHRPRRRLPLRIYRLRRSRRGSISSLSRASWSRRWGTLVGNPTTYSDLSTVLLNRKARRLRRPVRLLKRRYYGFRRRSRSFARVSFLKFQWKRRRPAFAARPSIQPLRLQAVGRGDVWSLIRRFGPVANLTPSKSFLSSRYRFFRPRIGKRFSRGLLFQAQFLAAWRLHSTKFIEQLRPFYLKNPYNFVNYKVIKKTLFRRLLSQKYRMDRNVQTRRFRIPSKRDVRSTFRHLGAPVYSYADFNFSLFTTPLERDRYAFYQRYDKYDSAWMHRTGDHTARIRRTRFKPGYQRMWRSERRVIKQVTGLTNRYQYRLTTKLQMMFFASQSRGVRARSISLEHALLLSQFAPDRWSSDLLFQHEYVYLNGQLATNPKAVTALNDFIQLIVTSRFYLLNRWLKSWTILRFRKWARRFYRTYRIKRKLFRDFTFRELPDAVMGLQNSWYDVPKFYEVDYFTLSIFVISSSRIGLRSRYARPVDILDIRIFNMYNWKYIT